MRRCRGSALVEFTLVAIPLLFVVISIFEMSRGMWMYHTLESAVTEGANWAAVNGQNCGNNANLCTCPLNAASHGDSIDCVARVISAAALGIPADTTNFAVTLTSGASSVSCNPLSSCFDNPGVWSTSNVVGTVVLVQGQVPFSSAIALFWPGAGSQQAAAVTLTASSSQIVQF